MFNNKSIGMAVIDTISRGFTYRVHVFFFLLIACIVFTAFHIAEVYSELDIHKKEKQELNLKLETFEKLLGPDAGRYFWTVFIRNAILRENPNLNPVEVIEWANVWYLVCRETGEDILLTLAIAYIESATWVTADERDSFVRFHPRAISPKGALGLFQLMSPTAREVADNLGIYYDKSVKSPSDPIISVGTDTSASVNEKRKLVREIIQKHIEKYPGSIEAVTLNPVNNIRMGIYYLAYLRKFNLPLEGRIESYNAGLAGHISGRAREETVPYREKVLWRYRVYKNEADSANFDLWTDWSTQVELSTPLTGSTQLSSTVVPLYSGIGGAESIEEAQ